METRFHIELDKLKVKVLQMAAMTERAFLESTKAFSRRDALAAQQIIDRDADINNIECEIDTQSLRLLALDQPVAFDLRLIVGCMRAVIDLERIGDEAVNVAERTILLARLPLSQVSPLMREFIDFSEKTLADSIQAFKDRDEALAQRICQGSHQGDEFMVRVVKDTMEGMGSDTQTQERAMHRVLVARSLERVAAQAANLAETTIFIVRGVSIKHHCHAF